MKRLLWVVVMLCVVLAPCAYADDIPILNVNITYVKMQMGPNEGSGDNVSFTFSGGRPQTSCSSSDHAPS